MHKLHAPSRYLGFQLIGFAPTPRRAAAQLGR